MDFMQKAAKEKSWLLWFIALAMLTCAPSFASSVRDLHPENRVEIFLGEGQNRIERTTLSPTIASSYYDSESEPASESSVAPNRGLLDTQLARDSRRYLQDIQQQTGMAVHPAQRAQLADHLRANSHSRLTTAAGETHRSGFSRVKDNLITQWEQQTGQVWPRYTQQVTSARTGRVLREVGDPYDAHHIIENVYEGPHTWWNLHPAEFPGAHQGGIHRSGGVLREIMP
jgi:hypothetical protein